MLILSRKVNEVIRIGDDVQVVVAQIGRKEVTIGIIAPMDVKVHREEVYQRLVTKEKGSG
jgi:carbon storage regulator